MTETHPLIDDAPASDIVVAPDRVPNAGQSITACRALAAPITVDRAARTVEVI